ncbi:PocR ligand-binding domain-containing protein [Candidatus Sumerlaeota bacterium]|nr:PocR ligand-binding domain-containing protein [Candidatus Sumerlaeota bacterium]
MNLTDLRGPAGRRRPPESPVDAEPTDGQDSGRDLTTRLSEWLSEFCRLHHLTVQILNGSGEVVIAPVREPSFCSAVKSAHPAGCPRDCGLSRRRRPASQRPSLSHCPYYLSNVAWTIPTADGKVWTVVLGRTLATQEQMSNCLDVVREAPDLSDDALAALGSIPWQAEPQLMTAAQFLRHSLNLILEGEWTKRAPKSKASSNSRRKKN